MLILLRAIVQLKYKILEGDLDLHRGWSRWKYSLFEEYFIFPNLWMTLLEFGREICNKEEYFLQTGLS